MELDGTGDVDDERCVATMQAWTERNESEGVAYTGPLEAMASRETSKTGVASVKPLAYREWSQEQLENELRSLSGRRREPAGLQLNQVAQELVVRREKAVADEENRARRENTGMDKEKLLAWKVGPLDARNRTVGCCRFRGH